MVRLALTKPVSYEIFVAPMSVNVVYSRSSDSLGKGSVYLLGSHEEFLNRHMTRTSQFYGTLKSIVRMILNVCIAYKAGFSLFKSNSNQAIQERMIIVKQGNGNRCWVMLNDVGQR